MNSGRERQHAAEGKSLTRFTQTRPKKSKNWGIGSIPSRGKIQTNVSGKNAPRTANGKTQTYGKSKMDGK